MAQIDAIFEQKWSKESAITFTQMESKLKGLTREATDNAQTYNWNKFTISEANENPSRHQPLTITPVDATTVPAVAGKIYQRYAIDSLDRAMTSYDYRNDLSTMLAAAVWQKFDKKLIAVVDAASISPTTLPTANAFNYAGAVALAKVLNLADVPDMGRFALVSAGAYEDLLTDTSAVNNFATQDKALKTGVLNGIAGFDKIVSTNYLSVPTASQRKIYAYKKEALGVHWAQPFKTAIEWSVDHNSWFLTGTMVVSFAVIDATGIVAAHVAD